ncbi:SAM hydrolase/SAM-dependent halogenase family protein [Halococcus sp. AFM35]|uniref:SAM hydrolase/SAM-dependent halogenase family protein n=1 Tax=Halococcus sp. AFM35 TaxID=3421653 RepID=UPI003EBF9E1E
MLTLSSDFGTPYPAAMKGVLLSKTDARLVDVSHDFPRQDVRTAAFWLREVLPYFPSSVHLVVVDPGVGTDRAALVVRAGDHAFVGPDNGVLVPAARRLADGGDIAAFAIEDGDAESSTFHGRDVFAPAAAAVHEAGIENIADLDRCTPVDDIEEFRFSDPEYRDDAIAGEVLVVDGFGNAITNVPGRVLKGRFGGTVAVNGESIRVARSYAHVEPGERLVTVGSHENVELAVNRGRGERDFGVAVGDTVRLSFE